MVLHFYHIHTKYIIYIYTPLVKSIHDTHTLLRNANPYIQSIQFPNSSYSAQNIVPIVHVLFYKCILFYTLIINPY